LNAKDAYPDFPAALWVLEFRLQMMRRLQSFLKEY